MTSFDHASRDAHDSSASIDHRPAPGRRTLTMGLAARAAPPTGAPVQRAAAGPDPGTLHQLLDDALRPDLAAARGTAGSSVTLPHLDTVQRSFGRHDVGGIEAHVGGPATDAAGELGASAFATGNHVAFAAAPDLFTAAHEAAHVVQQRGGVSLLGGLDGGAADPYEHHADAVAERVVRGESAEALLDVHAGGGGATATVQRRIDLQYLGSAKNDAQVAEVLSFLRASDRAYETTHLATVQGDDALLAALGDQVAAEEVRRYGFMQAADLVNDLRVDAKRAIRHGGKLYGVDRVLREAADSVYKVSRDDGADVSVIKQAGEGREALMGNEANLMEDVQGHANVVNIFDRAPDDSEFRMEHVPNGMLRDFDVDSEPKAKELARGIIAGLRHCHDQEVIHGDLDNKNVFIGGTVEAPVAKIGDFGSGQRGADALLWNLAGDVCGGVTMLKSLAQPFGNDLSQAFLVAVGAVEQAAIQLNQDAMMAKAQQDPAARAAEMGMTLEDYQVIMGDQPQVPPPTVERMQLLKQRWANLGAHAWLA